MLYLTLMKWARTSKGFTIVELLIVVVVVAILAAITIVAFNGIQNRARDSTRDSAARSIRQALEHYKTDNSELYPSCGTANVGYNSSCLATTLVPKYLQSIPKDPTTTKTIDYVVDTNQTGYGLLVRYEAKAQCKYLGGINPNSGWWGSSIAVCS